MRATLLTGHNHRTHAPADSVISWDLCLGTTADDCQRSHANHDDHDNDRGDAN